MRLPTTGRALVFVSALATAACATYSDDLTRGQAAFEQSEHERALALFRVLEPDIGRLSVEERAHYGYLRGMTDFRIGYKAEARHWLSMASAIETQTPGSLPPDWTKRMNESLKELNEAVYAGGIASLSNAASPTKSPEGNESSSDSDTAPAKDKAPPKADDK
jgi:hypothetical protein